MKIVHICLSNFFVDGVLYQENELVYRHVQEGHEVIVIASTESHGTNGEVVYIKSGAYIGVEGAKIIRLPYRRWMPRPISVKFRAHPGVLCLLRDVNPDVIVFHGSAGWELLTVYKYVKKNREVVFNIDSHSDATNSAKGFWSREILHRIFYGMILRRAMSLTGPLLCVAPSVMDFANKVYKVPNDKLEFYPLGGRIPSNCEYKEARNEIRNLLGLQSDDILVVQTGKLNSQKKLILSLNEFISVPNDKLFFAVAGVLQDDIKLECKDIFSKDKRIKFLGWQSSSSLTKLLCAADIYLQPGTQSATMQHSLCCRCAVILDDIPGHEFYMENTGWVISGEFTIARILSEIEFSVLEDKKLSAFNFAKNKLDYAKLARRVLMAGK